MAITTTVITGATSGIGKETALALAKIDHAVYLLVRDTKKGEEIRQEIISATRNNNIYIVYCDLADLETVRNASDVLRNSLSSIEVLINNAGGIFPERKESKDGFEMTFTVNHLGHFLLFNNLLPLLEKGGARVISLSSEAHRIGKPRFRDLQFRQSAYSAFKAYGMAKLFNIYFTRQVAVKYGPKGITAYAVHPGVVSTAFGTGLTGASKFLMWLAKPFMITAEEGAQTSIYLATAPKVEVNSGKYFKNEKPVNPSGDAIDDDARKKLWDISLKMIAPYV